MAGIVECLRDFLREYFTREVVFDGKPQASAKDTTRKAKSRRRCQSVPPSERFVWAMVVLIVALVGLIGIELVIILVTGAVNDVILVGVSGLVGALASRFSEVKR